MPTALIGTGHQVSGKVTTKGQLEAYKLWHARLGDAHPEKVKLVAEHTVGTPLALVPVAAAAKAAGPCSHCIRGKMRRGHVGDAVRRPTRFCEQVQIDVWGPFRVPSAVHSYRFAINCVDVATGYVAVYCRKEHTAEDLVDILEMFQGDVGQNIECLRTDNPPEMTGEVLQSYLAEKRIRWEQSTPYVHEELGHSERRWGMLVPMARTMLIRARMHLKFWADAMVHAAWIINRTPDASHDGGVCTPYERKNGEKPNLTKLRCFGCKAWAHLDPAQRKTKMDEVAVEGRFVGFMQNGAGWRIYADGRYYPVRFATFDESTCLVDSTATSDDSAGVVDGTMLQAAPH